MTKNEIFALLATEGVNRGHEVIGEFVVNNGRIKVDQVWVRRRTNMPEHQDRPNPEYWHLLGAFEIEGCNVPMSTGKRVNAEFTRHLENFQLLQQQYPNDRAQAFVVLYTKAYDRRHWPSYTDARTQELIDERAQHHVGIPVIDGRQLRERLVDKFGAAGG
jgi:hypothetical protein